jgi:hypothetical protein
MVDFSESQNTCIAAFNGWSQSRFEDWQLIDLLTQKTTYIEHVPRVVESGGRRLG